MLNAWHVVFLVCYILIKQTDPASLLFQSAGLELFALVLFLEKWPFWLSKMIILKLNLHILKMQNDSYFLKDAVDC